MTIIKNMINKLDKVYTNSCINIYFGCKKILLKLDSIEY